MNVGVCISTVAMLLWAGSATCQVSKAWNPDNGDGTYTNPVINADYSDPDVCKVGSDYYMTASSFNCIPGLQILHSKDLIHWKIVGAAIADYYPSEAWKTAVQHGNGVYAPSIRYHNGEFYIYYGDPDIGIFMTKAKDPEGQWSPLHLVRGGKGFIDPCPYWDENGDGYLVHALAGSRARFKSVLIGARLSNDGTRFTSTPKVIYDGDTRNFTVEGPKYYKRNGYYYIFSPAGSVPTGWQLVLRSKSPFGPFEEKVVLDQGETDINGPHQGAWVTTDSGEDWFFHFQDRGAYGRVVHLQPMRWHDDWPVMGEDADGDGCGQPVMRYKKPNIASTDKFNPQDSDEFNSTELGKQWQWQGLSNPAWHFNNAAEGVLRLFAVPLPEDYTNLSSCPNLLLQKFPAEEFTVTAALNYHYDTSNKSGKSYGGLVVMGYDYATLAFDHRGAQGLFLCLKKCVDAQQGSSEVLLEEVKIDSGKVFTRVDVTEGAMCQFSYSLDGRKFRKIGEPFAARQGKWIGAKFGLFLNRPATYEGRMDADWVRVE